jgi:hypothetical protein
MRFAAQWLAGAVRFGEVRFEVDIEPDFEAELSQPAHRRRQQPRSTPA